jgi:hypothetical protein
MWIFIFDTDSAQIYSVYKNIFISWSSPFKLVLYPPFLIFLGTRFRGAYVVTEPVVFHIAVHVRKVGLSSLFSRLTVSVTEM